MKSTTRKGFTLIELLIVVVIIGILAAIAIPKFANTKEKAYIAAMKTDLRNLVTAQEGYYADNQTYTNALANLNNFQPSANVTINIGAAQDDGWSAVATHAQVASLTTGCTVEVGSQVTGTNSDGVPYCQ